MIAVEGLSFGYRRNEPIIEDLTREFTRGQLTAVTGASGRGKSTLLYLIGLMLTPWTGDVMWDGYYADKLADYRRSQLRARRVGFVFQDAALDPTRSVLDNVTEGALYARLPRRHAQRRAAELLDRFGVELRSTHKPGEVSGGQAQRVALCRALLTDPDVLLADEPTGNLDHAASDVVLDAFAEHAAAGRTVVVATHDPQVVARCHQVLDL